MGLLLLPFMLVFAIAVIASLIFGIKSTYISAKDKRKKWLHYLMTFILSIVISVLAVLLTFYSFSGDRIYIFKLWLYINLAPLAAMIIVALIFTPIGSQVRDLRNSLLIGTLYIFPFSQSFFEVLIRWFSISTHY